MGWQEDGGVFVYTGITGCGKTHLARAAMFARVEATGWPYLIADLGPSKMWDSLPHDFDSDTVLHKLYGLGTWSCFSPKNTKEFDRVLRGIAGTQEKPGPGRVHALIDEVKAVASRRSISQTFTMALRLHRQGKVGPATYDCTVQGPGDLHEDFWRCLDGGLYVGRTLSGSDLETVGRFFSSEDRARIPTLARGEFLKMETGF